VDGIQKHGVMVSFILRGFDELGGRSVDSRFMALESALVISLSSLAVFFWALRKGMLHGA
jgi:hypothetical protein